MSRAAVTSINSARRMSKAAIGRLTARTMDSTPAKLVVASAMMGKRFATGAAHAPLQAVDELLRFYAQGWIVLPSQLRHWNSVMLVVLCYVALFSPFEVAFLEPRLGGALFWLNRVCDAIFVGEIAIGFLLAYRADGEVALVTSHRRIAARYVRGWFMLDVLGTIPFDLIAALAINARAAEGGAAAVEGAAYADLGQGMAFDRGRANMRALHLVRLLHLAKLLKVMRHTSLIRNFNRTMPVSYVWLYLLKTFVIVAFMTHWIACAWRLVLAFEMELGGDWWPAAAAHCGGSSNAPSFDVDSDCSRYLTHCDADRPALGWGANASASLVWRANTFNPCVSNTWFTQGYAQPGVSRYASLVHGRPRSLQETAFVYTVCAYWSVTTLSTVGYGDSGNPVNTFERGCAIACIAVGCVFWAYSLGCVQSLVAQLGNHGADFQRRMDNLARLAKTHAFPRELHLRTRIFFRERERMESMSLLRFGPISQLSPALRSELMEYVHRGWLGKITWVRDSPQGFVSGLLGSLCTATFAPQEQIVGSDLHVLTHGVVIKGMRVMLSGSVWGTDCILASNKLKNRFPARTLTHVDVCFLPQVALGVLLRAFPAEQRRFRITATWYALRNWMLWYVRQTKLAANRFQALLDAPSSPDTPPLVERFRHACVAWRRRTGRDVDKPEDEEHLQCPPADMEMCLRAAGFNRDERIERETLDMLWMRFDEDGDGMVSVREFLSFVTTFSSGELASEMFEGTTSRLERGLVGAMGTSSPASISLMRERKTSTRTTTALQIQELLGGTADFASNSDGQKPAVFVPSPTTGERLRQAEQLRSAETSPSSITRALSPVWSSPGDSRRGVGGVSEEVVQAAVQVASSRPLHGLLARRNQLVLEALAKKQLRRAIPPIPH